MNILILNSSGRSNGNTQRLLNSFENQLLASADMRKIPLDITHVLLSRQNIQSCRGCRACFDKGICPLKDDVAKIEELVLSCDALILGSPVYLEDVNGIMKNLIDRMAFHSHRPALYEKYAIVISTSGSGSSNHTLNTMRNALVSWGAHVIHMNKFRMGAYMEDDCIKKKYNPKLFELTTDLINVIQDRKSQKPTLYSLISFHFQQKYYGICNRAGDIDRQYWEEKGWLDPKVYFYIDTRCNPIKLLLSRVIGSLISKMFI